MSEGVHAPKTDGLSFKISIAVIIAAILGVVYFELTDPKGDLIEPAPSSSSTSGCA